MWYMPGPHLRRRMEQESGRAEGHSRKTTTYFGHHNAVEEFKKVLLAKYGSLVRAWRVGLDPDENGQMDFREFCQALRHLGYTGNIRTLWYLLDDDYSGAVSLKELDAPAAAALEKFRAVSTSQFEDIPEMFRKVMDKDKSNSVSALEFGEGARELGYRDEEEIQDLFNLLLLRPGVRHIGLGDIMFLQKWEDTKRQQLERLRWGKKWVNKDPYLAPSTSGSMSLSNGGNDKVSDAGTDYSAQVGIDWEEKKDAFRKFLINRYGSLPKAFEVMDANGSGELSLVEFQTVVASVLRYCRTGDAARLFKAFNGDDKDANLSWQELGVSRVEWTAYRMQRQLEKQKKAYLDSLVVHAPLGSSPRMQRAERIHQDRFRPRDPRSQSKRWAFDSPLPQGWGKPPDFLPPQPNKGIVISLPSVPQSAR
eukprot:TRINITY_DN21987_c0_g1_i1.p1 TRINITY_DN21987_c0_g1~~TRINITY_DN21987_c0_g1_i1.p1  ORF type:complete len:422 (+),score=74.59 TRINITY_DN21987_c0_g1_i1:57-1322(+)